MNSLMALSCALAAGLAAGASGSIVGVGGASTLIARPADAQLNTLTSSTQVFVWDESQSVVLDDGIRANAVLPGLYDAEADLATVNIARGTTVSSHYIHFDSPNSSSAQAEGLVRFDGDILGVIVVNSAAARRLDNTDFLGAPTLFTKNENARGLELAANSDRFEIGSDRRTLRYRFVITSPGDFVRVITVPTPGSMALMGMGAVVAVRRRRG